MLYSNVVKKYRSSSMIKIGRNDPCWCGSGQKYKKCHFEFDERLEDLKCSGYKIPPHKIIKTPEQIEGIKASARINIAVLDYVAEHIKAGISTEEINGWVDSVTREMGGIPAPLNYEGFPKSVCTSLNDEVCHGIPADDIILKDGDIINVDVSTIYNGYFSDSSRMFCIGNVSEDKKKLVKVAKECLDVGLKEVKPFTPLGNMSNAINTLAKSHGYSIVREIGGHGCGLEFHEEPWVGYTLPADTGMILAPGMCFTIEPMVNMGKADIVQDDENGWTIYTEDGSPSAQWEIQVLVTEDGAEIISY